MYKILQFAGMAWNCIRAGISSRERAIREAAEAGSDQHPTRVVNEKAAIIWDFTTDLDAEPVEILPGRGGE